jgi:hypothetical protein
VPGLPTIAGLVANYVGKIPSLEIWSAAITSPSVCPHLKLYKTLISSTSPAVKCTKILELDVNDVYLLTDLMRIQWEVKLLQASYEADCWSDNEGN